MKICNGRMKRGACSRFVKNLLSLAPFLCLWAQLPLMAASSPASVLRSVPEILAWKLDGVMETYKPEDYPAQQTPEKEILGEYGFVSVARQVYSRGTCRAKIEIDEMLDTAAAFGLFTFMQVPESKALKGIGNVGEERSLHIAFAQNRYYVSISAITRSLETEGGLRDLAKIVSHLLPTSFSLPPLVSKLPKENLVPGSTLFVLGPRALSRRFSRIPEDLFGLGIGAEAALGRYKFADDSATLLLISYPTQQLAKKLLEKGYNDFAAKNPSEPIFYKREGPVAVIVMGAGTAEAATSLLDKVTYASTVSWDPKTQPLGVGRMMLNIFTYTGVMLALTLGAGILFGIIRISVKRMFPGKVFDRPEIMEIIRLNLQSPGDRRH